MTDRQRAYRAFLRTEFWKNLTIEKKASVGRCERCPEVDGLQSHHIFYRSDWFETELGDLEVLCEACHQEEHFGPIPDWNSPEEEKKYLYHLISEAGRFFAQELSAPVEMTQEIEDLSVKYRDDPPVMFQIRNCLRFAVAMGVPFESEFAPATERELA